MQDRDELVRRVVGQWTQEHSIDHGKDRSVCADAEGDRNHSYKSKAAML
jgi:hypothetical protein